MRGRIAFLSLIVLFVGFAVYLGIVAEASWDDTRKANAQHNCDEVQTFSGSGIKETQPFTVSGDTWRLRYDFESTTPDQQSSSFDMSVYKTGNTIPQSVITLERPGSDTTYVNAGAGTYYLSIESANATWSVTVEECSASAPPGSPNPGGPASTSAPASTPASTSPPPKPKPSPKPKPPPKPKPKGNLFDSGGPTVGPAPLMPDGGCPKEYPIKRADACYTESRRPNAILEQGTRQLAKDEGNKRTATPVSAGATPDGSLPFGRYDHL